MFWVYFLIKVTMCVQLLCHVQLFVTCALQHTSLPCPSLSPRVCSNSHPLSWWCYQTISSSATHFSFRRQPFPASESFPVSQLLTLGGQSIGASATILPMNTQGWFPSGSTVLILQYNGLSRVFSNITIWRHQFFGAQPALVSNSHIYTRLLEKPQLWLYRPLLANWYLCFIIKNNNFERFCQIPLQWGWSNSSPPSSA